MRPELEKAIFETSKTLFGVEVPAQLTRPDEQFGDYATNVALQLAGQLGKPPQEIADQLANKLREILGQQVSEINVVSPGFLNLRLSDQSLLAAVHRPEHPKVYADQTVVIETNNPNPFKDIHIGHAFNSVVADTLANLLEAGRANTHRVSYHGDVGLHVGKSMWAILKFINGDIAKLNNLNETERPKFLSQKYAEGTVAYDQDELAKQDIERCQRILYPDRPTF